MSGLSSVWTGLHRWARQSTPIDGCDDKGKIAKQPGAGTHRMRYRPEIDGLRAIAVVPVVLFHVGFPQVRGGSSASICFL